ncbi:VWA domain-containing protein [Plantactinospora sp. B24E8]|uniref:vWA domain-containing protein n=1 Tax=Plantactinospora sp. B24E8 TaxID=3153567 RepID=UPI00325EB432
MSGGNRFRYGSWRGGPDPLAPPYDVRAAVDSVGAEVLAGGSLRDALRNLLRRGPEGRGGLDDLLARARRLRREALRRGDLDGAVTRARALLDQALAAERDELRGRDDPEARFNEAVLDNLPRSTARAVEELSGYRWASDQARATYQQILDGLRRDVLEQRFSGLRDAMRDAADPAVQRQMAEMLRDLNDLLARHDRGEDTTDAFAEFMRRHGDLFPEKPANVDELVDALARRAAAGERLMRSLPANQREELARMMESALGPELANQMAQLGANLRSLRPDLSWDRAERVRGDQPLGYGEAAGALGEIADLDDLLDQLGQEHPGATLDDIDVESVQRNLGRDAADDVRRLRELERELRRQGWVSRGSDGLTLSPKALRRLGGTALRRIFSELESGRRGEHDLRSAGAAGEVTGASRPWEYGDEQPLDVVRTVARAVRRGGARVPVTLAVEDFEVVETERRASTAVALCVDLSFSMISEGRWGPMKQTALALAHLIATRFPQDSLQIIGFGREAMPLSQQELAGVEPDLVQGTNLQHALKLAGRHLRRHPGAEPVVLVVTDGEPTAHLDPETGGGIFNWPPLRETIEATVAEVDQLTRYGATMNLFMLGEDPGLRRFVDAVARRSGGRVFTPELEDLGRYVVSDYLRTRRGRR